MLAIVGIQKIDKTSLHNEVIMHMDIQANKRNSKHNLLRRR